MTDREPSHEAARLYRELAEILAEILVADLREFPESNGIPSPDDVEPGSDTSGRPRP